MENTQVLVQGLLFSLCPILNWNPCLSSTVASFLTHSKFRPIIQNSSPPFSKGVKLSRTRDHKSVAQLLKRLRQGVIRALEFQGSLGNTVGTNKRHRLSSSRFLNAYRKHTHPRKFSECLKPVQKEVQLYSEPKSRTLAILNIDLLGGEGIFVFFVHSNLKDI